MKKSVFYEHIAEAAIQTGLTLTEVLQKVKSFGIDCVEVENTRLIQDTTLARQLEDAGLKISGIYGFLDYKSDTELQKGKELVSLASSLHVHNILVIPGFVAPELLEEEQKQVYQAEVAAMIRYVDAIVMQAAKVGITVGMEDFDDRIAPFSTISGLKEFAVKVPELKLTFDTGNFLYSEEDVLTAYEELKSYIGYVHLKDRSFTLKSGEQPKNTVKQRAMYSASVGSGVIPMKEIVQKLKQSGYDGTLAIEHFGSQNQLEDMKASAAWIDLTWKETV